MDGARSARWRALHRISPGSRRRAGSRARRSVARPPRLEAELRADLVDPGVQLAPPPRELALALLQLLIREEAQPLVQLRALRRQRALLVAERAEERLETAALVVHLAPIGTS